MKTEKDSDQAYKRAKTDEERQKIRAAYLRARSEITGRVLIFAEERHFVVHIERGQLLMAGGRGAAQVSSRSFHFIQKRLAVLFATGFRSFVRGLSPVPSRNGKRIPGYGFPFCAACR